MNAFISIQEIESDVVFFLFVGIFLRNDLANVVRRRGYKLIRDLLSSSTESDSDELPNMGKILAKGQDAINHSADIIATGQCLLLLSLLEFLCLSSIVVDSLT